MITGSSASSAQSDLLNGYIDLFQCAEPEPQEYLVEGLIPENEISIFFGDGGSGKSYIALNISIHVALGKSFYGLPTRAGKVLYLDIETNQETVLRRTYALRRGLEQLEPANNRLIYRRLAGPLSQPEVQSETAAAIASLQPDLIVLDSLTMASREDMNDAQATLDVLNKVKSWGKTALIIDHVAKGGAERGRPDKPWGSVFKYNMARSVIRVEKGRDWTVKLEQTKSNDGAGQGRLCLRPEFRTDSANPNRLEFVRYALLDAFEDFVGNSNGEASLDERVIAALSRYPDGTGAKAIAVGVGVGHRVVSNRLSKLKASGRIEHVGRDVWRLAQSEECTRMEVNGLPLN